VLSHGELHVEVNFVQDGVRSFAGKHQQRLDSAANRNTPLLPHFPTVNAPIFLTSLEPIIREGI
jgi:hypothetical protein